MRVALFVTLVVGCALPSSRLPAPREPTFPEVPTITSRITDLRTTLARAGIRLAMRGVETESSTSWCDLPDPAMVEAGCTRCDLADETDPFDLAVIEALTVAVDRYPTSTLDAAKIDEVALCRHLGRKRLARGSELAGTADPQVHRLLISLESFGGTTYDPDNNFTVEDIVHHELFHMLDFATMPETAQLDLSWTYLNPLGFEYRDPALGTVRPAGFVDVYGTTDEMEDRATVYQYLMARPTDLCAIAESDPIVRAKAAAIWARVAAVAGDEHLRLRASCADWLTSTPPRRAPIHVEPDEFTKRFGHAAKDQEWLTPPSRPRLFDH